MRKGEKNETKFIMQDTPTVRSSNTWSNAARTVYWKSRHNAERELLYKTHINSRINEKLLASCLPPTPWAQSRIYTRNSPRST